MSGPGPTLRDIHRLHRFIKNLQEELDRVPRQLKAQQARVARQEELLKQAQDELKHLKVATHEKETSLKTTHTLIAKHLKQQNEAGGKKEYDALQAEITAEKQNVQRLENEILDNLGEMEEKTIKIPELEKNVKQAKADFTTFENGVQARLADLNGQLEQAKKDLKVVEAQIPADRKAQLERIIASKGDDALAVVKNRNCTACHTAITSQNYNDLVSGMFVLCVACGRILYLPE
ncbi:MAG: zinc ribbon domain-containing protein [Gemmataceae bacterium]